MGSEYSESIEYGNAPYPVRVTYEDRSGNTAQTSQRTARIVISYGKNFNAWKLSYYDAKGERVTNSDNGISEAVFEHDPEKGFLISESFYDEKLAPVMCHENYSRRLHVRVRRGSLSGFRACVFLASHGRPARRSCITMRYCCHVRIRIGSQPGSLRVSEIISESNGSGE